ncbi:phytoene desaturase [soil metagenome]
MSKEIVVIGAGFGGIAAAVRLVASGHHVTIVEKLDRPGGRGYVFEDRGFVFDGGPTVITAPWLITELFDLAGRRAEDAIDLMPVDPFYRIYFHDGTSFDYTGDPAAMERQIAKLSSHPEDVEGYRKFLRQSERIFEKGFVDLADRPFLSVLDMVKIAPDLLKLEAYRSVYSLVSKYIKDDRLRQILSFHPLLIGGSPFRSPSIYALIHHLERTWGVWFARGGTGAVINALVDLFLELGGTLELNVEVVGIETSGRHATGVTLRDGRTLPADIVVSNADAAQTYASLLPPEARRPLTRRKLKRMHHSMSLVVIYFGTDRLYRDDMPRPLAHHTIILGPRYRELLEDIFERKVLADDFSLYLHMPTLTDPSLAPDGCEAFYVLAPVPNLTADVDWAQMAKPFRDRIMGFLEEHYLPGLSNHIVTERMIDPRYFRDTLNSYEGSAFAVEPLLTQSAYFRPHNQSQSIENLYLVGAGTHPGAGLPGVLSSAKIAANLINSIPT